MRGHRLLVAATVLIGAMAWTCAAQAATLGFQEGCCFARLIYTGKTGEANHLTVTGRVGLDGTPLVMFTEPGHRITPDTSYDANSTATTLTECVFAADSATCQDNTSGWTIDLGDGNDAMTFNPPPRDAHGGDGWPRADLIDVQGGVGADVLRGAWTSGSTVTLEGGPGDDRLFAGGSDRMIGGPGADTMAGLAVGPAGTASYDDSAQTGVTVTLDGVANDGAPGENDDVEPTVARVVGTEQDDSLTAATTTGHELDGQGGNDRLDSGGGSGALYGGPGDDVFLANDGVHQFVSCGDGSDTVAADPIDTLTADCEFVSQS